ncbi:MAG: AAA family ATPase [Clostridia bacterium]|nr:AAA family ATPase [Clostridia bacterium]
MCTKKQYTIIAGANGAGKSTLYKTSNARIQELTTGIRLNSDEIVKEMGLDWRSVGAQIAAGKEVLRRLDACFANGESCNQETTLCGSTIMKSVRRAKDLGYSIIILYVGVASPNIAAERVAARVANGGHGVSEATIERRFSLSVKNLKKVIPYCECVYIYDNTQSLKCVAEIASGVVVNDQTRIPGSECLWASEIIEGLPYECGD